MKTFVKIKSSSFLFKYPKNWRVYGPPPPPFFKNHSIQTMGKPFRQINKYANFALIIHLRKAEIEIWIN